MTRTKQRGTLSAEVGTALSRLSAQGLWVFSLAAFAEALRSDKARARKLLYELRRSGWVARLRSGKYLIVPLEAGPESAWSEDTLLIGSHLSEPAAAAYWSACHYWGWTEQVPRTVFIQTPRRIRGPHSRKILGVQYRFIRVQPSKFFGTVGRQAERGQFTVTDREKTLIDCLDHPELCGGIGRVAEMLPEAAGLDWSRVDEYLKRMGSGAVYKRLGLLVEHLGDRLKVPDRRKRIGAWQAKLTGGYAPLEPGGPQTGRVDNRWRVRLNVAGVLRQKGRP